MKKGVIFDLDGTLLNTLDDLATAGNHVLKVLGREEYPVEAYKLMVGNGIPNLVHRLLAGTNAHTEPQVEKEVFAKVQEPLFEKALAEFMDFYSVHSEDQTAPYEGIEEMLARLKTAGVKMAVVSNKADGPVKQLVPKYFGQVFTVALGSRPGVPNKPDPASTREALQLLGLTEAEVLYVGDSNVDMITANNAGLESCGVLWGFRDEKELRTAGAKYLATTATELEKLILE